jgi:hypothetical protein
VDPDLTNNFKELSNFVRSITHTVIETLDNVIAKQEELIDQILLHTLTSRDPVIFIVQKIVLVFLVILVVLIVATYIAGCVAVVEDCIKWRKKRRQRKRIELIPTYHNVRALRQTALETPFQGISYETLPPPPEVHVPSAPALDELIAIDYNRGKRLKSFSRK